METNNLETLMRSPEEGPSRGAGPAASGGSGHTTNGQWRGRLRDPRREQTGNVPRPEMASAPIPEVEDLGPSSSGTHSGTEATPSESALSESQPATTKAGLPRTRIKWTIEMNTHIMRCYYTITNMERNLSNYRQQLHQQFIQKYPQFSHLTEQRIADQRRVINTRNLIPQPTLMSIQRDVEGSIQATHRRNETDNVPEPNRVVDNEAQTMPAVEMENPVISKMSADAEYMLTGVIDEYSDTDPLRRDRLPRLHTSKTLSALINTVNHALSKRVSSSCNLGELHFLTYCGAVTVIRLLGIKSLQHKPSRKKKPSWEHRYEKKISELRICVGRLQAFLSGQAGRRVSQKVKYIMRQHGLFDDPSTNIHKVMEILDFYKQKLAVTASRLTRYKKANKRKNQNWFFKRDERKFYQTFSQQQINDSNQPNRKEMEDYWQNIWSTPGTYNQDAEWLGAVENHTISNMNFNAFTMDDLKAILTHTPNWKAPGPEHVHTFWIKKFPCLHEPLLNAFNVVVSSSETIPSFLTCGLTYLKPKSQDSTNPSNYRPITCLPSLYKILSALIAHKIREHVGNNNILAEEQKGCTIGAMGAKEHLIIDTVATKQAQCRKRNMWTAYIDYQKAFDSTPHSWLIEVLRLYKIHPLIINLLLKLMKEWRVNLVIPNEKIFEYSTIRIRRGIFQGDSLSPLWFCLAINPLSTLLSSTKYGFTINSCETQKYKLSHLFYMDDIKLYAGKKEQLHYLINITRNFSEDIGMRFGLEKCKARCLIKGAVEPSSPIHMDEGQQINFMEKRSFYKYLGMLQEKVTDQKLMRETLRTEYTRRATEIFKSELNFANVIRALNSYATPVLTYSFGVLKWSRTALDGIMRETRVLMTKYGLHHPKSAIERLSLPTEKGGCGILDLTNLHAKQRHNLREYFYGQQNKPLYKAVIEADLDYSPLNMADRTLVMAEIEVSDETKEASWAEKSLHGKYHYALNLDHVDKIASNSWLRYGGLYAETAGFMLAIQDQVICTKYHRKHIIQEKSLQDDKCRLCGKAPETIDHIIAGCQHLAPTDYKERHDHVATILYLELARDRGLLCKDEREPYYKYRPNPVLENEEYVLYWDRTILTDRSVSHNRPDLVLKNLKDKTMYLIDIAVVNNGNVMNTWSNKISKYQELSQELVRIWQQEKVTVVPIVISTNGLIPKNLHSSLKELGLNPKIYKDLQKSVVLDVTRTVRKFLNHQPVH